MADDGSGERPYVDTVAVPGVLVMPGDPDPTEFWSRYPEAFRVPVRIVWGEEADGQAVIPTILDNSREEHQGAPGSAEMIAAEHFVPPAGSVYGSDPVGMFLTVNDALDRLSGQGSPEMRLSTLAPDSGR